MVSGVLDQARELTIGGHVHQVRDHAYLVGWIEVEIEVIQTAEAELDTNPGEAPAIWTHIAKHAGYLEELLAAQEQWLADHDAELAVESDSVRAAIRNLSPSSYKGGKAGDA